MNGTNSESSLPQSFWIDFITLNRYPKYNVEIYLAIPMVSDRILCLPTVSKMDTISYFSSTGSSPSPDCSAFSSDLFQFMVLLLLLILSLRASFHSSPSRSCTSLLLPKKDTFLHLFALTLRLESSNLQTSHSELQNLDPNPSGQCILFASIANLGMTFSSGTVTKLTVLPPTHTISLTPCLPVPYSPGSSLILPIQSAVCRDRDTAVHSKDASWTTNEMIAAFKANISWAYRRSFLLIPSFINQFFCGGTIKSY